MLIFAQVDSCKDNTLKGWEGLDKFPEFKNCAKCKGNCKYTGDV